MINRSTLSGEAPPTRIGIGWAGAGPCLRTTSGPSASTSTLHTTENALRSSRLRMRTRTGLSNFGKRTDSWKPRLRVLASSVLRHSPKMVLKPREYSSAPLFASATSTRFTPRSVWSSVRAMSPGHGSGSITTRSIAYCSASALPLCW